MGVEQGRQRTKEFHTGNDVFGGTEESFRGKVESRESAFHTLVCILHLGRPQGRFLLSCTLPIIWL